MHSPAGPPFASLLHLPPPPTWSDPSSSSSSSSRLCALTSLTLSCGLHRSGLLMSDQTPPNSDPHRLLCRRSDFRGCLIHPDDAILLSPLLKMAFRGLEKAFLPPPHAPAIHIQPTPLPLSSLLPPPQLLLPSSHPPCHGVLRLISQ